jgi:3-hydroxyacyl-[acyl-carrier-protein] dehydratase
MLETVTQTAVWLLHVRRDFACSIAVLKEARNVKYGQFVAPGNLLRVEVELVKLSETGATFKAAGSVGDDQAILARLELAYFNLGDKNADLKELDDRLIEHNRRRWAVLTQDRVVMQ